MASLCDLCFLYRCVKWFCKPLKSPCRLYMHKKFIHSAITGYLLITTGYWPYATGYLLKDKFCFVTKKPCHAQHYPVCFYLAIFSRLTKK